VPVIARVIVAIDFSPSSRSALDYATLLAATLGASMEVVHVREPPGYVGPDTMALLPIAAGQPGFEQTRGEVQRELEGALARAPSRPARHSVRIESGEPSDAILQVAADSGADLIVMGTHGRSGLARALLGSVAESVLRRAACPVLTIRVAQRTSREPVPM
jgi:nucleotide-binding universal stress UspA family protein